MKSLALLVLLLTQSAFASTLVKCVVPFPRNVLIVEIADSKIDANLTQLSGNSEHLTSTDGIVFESNSSSLVLQFAPGLYTSPASRTHAIMSVGNGQKVLLNCIKRNIVQQLQNETNVDNSLCVVETTRTGNPHRDMDNKMRQCRAKALSLNLDSIQNRACIAYCMKN